MQIRVLIPLVLLLVLPFTICIASAGFDDGLGKAVVTPVEVPKEEPAEYTKNTTNTVSEYTKADWLAGGFETGLLNFVMHFVDALNSLWRGSLAEHKVDENGAVIDQYGNVRGGVFIVITENVEPDKMPDIQKFVTGTKAEWCWLVLTYLFGYVFAIRIRKQTKLLFEQVLNDYDLSDSRYTTGFLLCIASYIAPRAVIIAVEVCSIISKFFMIQVMDYIEPSAETAYMYIMMGIGEAIVGIPFVIRQWIIVAVYATCRFLIVSFAMGFFKPELIRAYDYFKKILAIQPICVGFTSFCLVCIRSTHLESFGLLYALMFLTVAYILKNFMFGGHLDGLAKNIVYTRILRRSIHV